MNATAETKAPGSGPNPYSDCGIGAALFPNHPVGAVISNVIWDIGSTALTSATASPETCNGKNVKAAAFIMDSYDQLLEETAKGSGQHIATLLNILEVEQHNRQAATQSIRNQIAADVSSATFTSATKVQKAEAYYNATMTSVSDV